MTMKYMYFARLKVGHVSIASVQVHVLVNQSYEIELELVSIFVELVFIYW